jgi:hypothetical protein
MSIAAVAAPAKAASPLLKDLEGCAKLVEDACQSFARDLEEIGGYTGRLVVWSHLLGKVADTSFDDPILARISKTAFEILSEWIPRYFVLQSNEIFWIDPLPFDEQFLRPMREIQQRFRSFEGSPIDASTIKALAALGVSLPADALANKDQILALGKNLSSQISRVELWKKSLQKSANDLFDSLKEVFAYLPSKKCKLPEPFGGKNGLLAALMQQQMQAQKERASKVEMALPPKAPGGPSAAVGSAAPASAAASAGANGSASAGANSAASSNAGAGSSAASGKNEKSQNG